MGNFVVNTPPEDKSVNPGDNQGIPDLSTGFPEDFHTAYAESLREFDALYEALAQ